LEILTGPLRLGYTPEVPASVPPLHPKKEKGKRDKEEKKIKKEVVKRYKKR